MEDDAEIPTQPAADPKAPLEQSIFLTLFDHSPDAILVARNDGRIIEASLQSEALFGYTHEELVGKRIEDLLPERFRSSHVQHRSDYAAAPHRRSMG